MENKQTPVNWLIKNLMLNGLIRLTKDQHSLYKELTEEAKAMEREQIIDAYDSGLFDGTMDDVKDRIYTQYYDQTFKSE